MEAMRRVVAVLAAAVLVTFVALAGVVPAQGVSPGAAPMAVPPATGNNAVITVKVGADRQGTTGVSGLAGTTLQLYDGTTAPTTPVTDAWATCTSDADGDCSFVVPDTQAGLFGCFGAAGANCDRRFWIVQTGVPDGFTQNATFRTGSGDGSASQLTPYQFRTGPTLRAGSTYSSDADFMIGTGSTNRTASGGIWQQSRTNPAPVQSCGLRVALVLDLSGSVTASQLVQLKAASDQFVDSLVGTPSEMALFSFSTSSPAVGATQNYPGLTSISTQTGADAFKSRYAAWTAGGGTNWDRGLAATAEADSSYDIAVVITDGNPTFYGQPAEGPGNFARIREMENGVFSANAAKAQGTRVLAVGVGTGVSDSATGQNLRAISGTTAYDGTNATAADYYQVADYSVVGQALRQLALGECAGSLSVVKQIVGSDGAIADATPGGAGWTFGASTASTGVTLPTTSATTDSSSAVNFPITYAGGATSGTIEIQEEPQAGSALFPVEGQNAVCTDLVTTQAVPVVNVGATGFSVDVPGTDAVSCQVYNQVAGPASVSVGKEWVINGADPVPNGNQPGGFTSQLTLTGPGGAGATNQPWQVARTGYVAGESVTVGEEVTLQAPDIDAGLCEVAAPQIVEIDGEVVDPVPVPDGGYVTTLIEGANTFTIRNTVTCESRLTLAKNVEGSADPALWTLDALPAPDAPAGQLPGPSGQAGSAGVTDVSVTAGVPYQLAESGGPATYLQTDQRTSQQTYPLSTGSWTCIRIDADGSQVSGFNDGLNGGVTVPIAERVRCTATNQTAQLTLAKDVINVVGGTAVPADFTLRAVPSTTPAVDGLDDVEVTGAAQADAEVVEIRPDHTYTLSETGPPGFTLTDLECVIDGQTQQVTEITASRGESIVCTFVNIDDPAVLTLRKVVDEGSSGATQTPADWTLTATPQGIASQDPVSGNGADGVTDVEVAAGSYALTESTVAGFDAGTWGCEDAGGEPVTVTAGAVTLANGADVTCTITNTAQQPTLTLVKTLTTDDGGTAVVGDWTLTATGPTTGLTGATGDTTITAAPVAIGSYALTEDGPTGYTAGDWTCADGATDLPVTDGAVTIALGQDVTCTITNDDQPALLTLRKTVEAGTTGATQTPATWTLTATGPDTVTGNGADGVTAAEVTAGSYALTESTVAGFTAGTWSCLDADGAVPIDDGTVTLANGADVTCTITNTAQQPTLTLVKTVTNDDGGTAEDVDWTLTATGPTTGLTGATGDTAITAAPVAIGSYALTEDGPTGYTAGDWTCTDGATDLTVTDGAVTIALGQDVTCTITNDDQPALLTLRKTVEAGTTGATQTPATWTLTATGPDTVTGNGADGVTAAEVTAGSYTLTESTVAGFTAGTWSCLDADGAVPVDDGTVTLANGADVTCTITNTAQQPTLTLVKTLTTDDGGTAVVGDWTLTATGPTAGLTGTTGDTAITAVPVAIGTYTLTEDGPAGYAAGSWTCADGATDIPATGGAVTVSLGQNVTCTIANNDQPALLTLRKTVDGGATGSTAEPADWTVRAAPEGIEGQDIVSGNGEDGVTAEEVFAGPYALSESFVAGFSAGTWSCADAAGAVDVDEGTVTLTNGADVTCTITNTAVPSTLTLLKTVSNDDGGTADARDWVLTALGPTTSRSGASGDDVITQTPVEVGSHALSESGGPAGYTTNDWTCADGATDLPVESGSVLIGLGQDVTCTVLNDDQPGTLTLVKQLVNDGGGTAEATDWTLVADGPTTGITGPTGSAAVTGVDVSAGAYATSETGGPLGYSASAWTCTGGVLSGATVTVANGEDVTCTITNRYQPPRLTLVKELVNDGGGTALATDWTLSAEGPNPVSGTTGSLPVTGAPVLPGTYTLSEAGPAGYSTTGWACENRGTPVTLTGSALDLAAGDDVTCTVTNVFTPAQTSTWTVEKSSDPPSGTQVEPDEVVTYTIRAGIVTGDSADDVVIVDDLSGVLGAAALLGGSIEASAGTASVSGTRLTWTLGTLQGTQALTYQVRVDDDVDGDVLRNVVTAPGALSCLPEGTALGAAAVAADDCRTTTHTTPRPSGAGWLSDTGGPGPRLLVSALALLAAGAAMTWGARRRRGADLGS